MFELTINPIDGKRVTAPRAAIAVQPSRMGASGGPIGHKRWSEVHSESQPARSAARAAPRSPIQSVRWVESRAPIFTVPLVDIRLRSDELRGTSRARR